MRTYAQIRKAGSFTLAIGLLLAGSAFAQQNDMDRIAKEVFQGYSSPSVGNKLINQNDIMTWAGNPNSADAHLNKAREYANQNNFGEALQQSEKAIAINPNNSTAYFVRGAIYVR